MMDKAIISKWLDHAEDYLVTLSSEVYSITPDEVRERFGEDSNNWLLESLAQSGWSLDTRVATVLALIRVARLETDREKALNAALSALWWAGLTTQVLHNQANPSELSWQVTPSAIAAVMAGIGRHRETKQIREFAIQYWRENIDPKLSASKAADIIKEKNIVNLSHKKISEYISAEKRRLKQEAPEK